MPAVYLINNSGGNVPANRIVAIHTTKATSFTLPTSVRDANIIGITQLAIDTGASGPIKTCGPSYVYGAGALTTGRFFLPDGTNYEQARDRADMPMLSGGLIVSGAGAGANSLVLVRPTYAGILNQGTTLPSTGVEGQEFFHTDTSRYLIYNGSGFQTVQPGGAYISDLDIKTELYFFDDFLGDQFQSLWNSSGANNAIATPTSNLRGGIAQIQTTGTDNNAAYLDWGSYPSLDYNDLPTIEMRIKANENTDSNVWFGVANTGNIDSATRAYLIGFDTDDGGNVWRTRGREDSGDWFGQNTTKILTTTWHIWKFEFTASQLRIYQDGVLVGSRSNYTNTPPTFAPVLFQRTRTTAAATLYCDYILAYLTR